MVYIIIFCLWQKLLPLRAEDAPEVEVHRDVAATQKSAPKDKDSGWLLAESSRGNFSVLVPVPFEEMTIHAKGEKGNPFALNIINAKSMEGFTFHVMESAAPEMDAASWLQKNIQALSEGSGLQKIDRTSFGAYPAVAAFIKKGNTEAFMRAVHGGGFTVLMVFEYPELYSNAARPMGLTFLSSLRIKAEDEQRKAYPVGLMLPEISATGTIAPPTNKVWMANDYRQVAELIIQSKMPLPTQADAASRELFSKIVSRDNLAFASDKTLPPEQRMAEMMEILNGISAIQKMYAMQVISGDKITKDYAVVQTFVIYVFEMMWSVSNEYLSALPKDERNAARMDGLEKLRTGFYQTLLSALILALDDTCPSDCRMITLVAINETMPKHRSLLSRENAATLRRLVEKGIKKPQDKTESELLYDVLKKMQ